MKKIDKREHSLYGIVYPHDMRLLRKELDKLSSGIKEIYSQNDPQQLVRIEFDYNLINKGDVYKLLVMASKLPYGIRYSGRKMEKMLALFTNLSESPSRDKRINNVHCMHNYYKKRYK